MTTRISGSPDHQVDYDLHGLVGIRLVNPSVDDVAGVTRQLGPIRVPRVNEPDIVIRFVDRLRASSTVRYLGSDEAGFTEDAFFVLQGKNGARVWVQIPFEQIGKRCEIVCERGVQRVPLLIPILNLTALSKGVIPLHAAAFTYKNTGVVVTGWAKGGKTETLLGFMAQGATYVGDEWIYLTKDGLRMHGLPEPIRLWESHLKDLPQYRARIRHSDRARLTALRFVTALMERKSGGRRANEYSSLDVSIRLNRLLKRQQYVQIGAQKLFGNLTNSLTGVPDKFFFVVSHESTDVRVEPIDAEEVASRMVFSLQHERQDFMSWYLKFRFAFPGPRNKFIEQAEELQREMLLSAIADKPAYIVYHPYPASIPALFEAINPLINPSTDPKADFEPVKRTTLSPLFAEK
jgi:hypothetical protein